QAQPMLVGAVPFRVEDTPRLVVPERVRWSQSLAGSGGGTVGPGTVRAAHVESWRDRERHDTGVRDDLDRFGTRHLAEVGLGTHVASTTVGTGGRAPARAQSRTQRSDGVRVRRGPAYRPG